MTHPLYEKSNACSSEVIGAAIEVHREHGPGLLESVYEWSLMMEFQLRGIPCTNQDEVVVRYKQYEKKVPLRCDLLVDACLLVEVKAIDSVLPIHKAQLLSYMKLLNIPVGLLLNFNCTTMKEGIHRLILSGANTP